MKKLTMVVAGTFLTLGACVSAPFAFSAYEESQRIETSSGEYVVGQSPDNPNVWGATFDNTFNSYPDPFEMKATGSQAIEEASGCKVNPDSVEVQQTGFAVLWARVDCG
jgi:hypothetical protein